jgi:gamma-glutamyltranspeptidase
MNPTPRNPQVERISAAANPTLKSLRRLAQGSDAYREQGRLWLEGDHLLQAALARGVALQLALVSEQAFYEGGGTRRCRRWRCVRRACWCCRRRCSAVSASW